MIKYISVKLKQEDKLKLALKTRCSYQPKAWKLNLANTHENAVPF